jgi:16S rRNA processing protein RimM
MTEQSIPSPSTTEASLPKIPCPFQSPEWVAIAMAQGGHGVKGDIKLKTFDSQPDWLDTLKTVKLWASHPALQAKHPQGVEWHVTNAHYHVHHRVVISVKEITNPEDAQLWSGSQLFLHKDELPAVDETDTYRTIDLVGLTVLIEETNQAVGVVSGIISTARSGKAGADYDFLEITYQQSGRTEMVPFIKAFVGEVDLTGKTVFLHGLQSFLEEGNTPALPKEVKQTPYQRRKQKKAALAAEMALTAEETAKTTELQELTADNDAINQ